MTNQINDIDTDNMTTQSYYLPDLSQPMAVLSMVLSIELIVFLLSLFKYNFASPEFFAYFFGLSFVMLWIGFVFAISMRFLRKQLENMTVARSTFVQLSLLVLITLGFLFIARMVVLNYLSYSPFADSLRQNTWSYYLQNALVSVIVGGLLLRYFFVAHQNQEKLKAINVAQVQALQSRIRPHFLFNSLNSIASLVSTDADLAEQAVEDLSDLFRVSLADSERRVTIKEELEIARLYQRMEQLRLGDRLTVKWQVNELPLRQKVPALMLQPLLENAIYHGIEPIVGGGTVQVNGQVVDKLVQIDVINPVSNISENSQQRRKGNQIALQNIQSRLRLLYGDKAEVDVQPGNEEFKVSLRFPLDKE